MLKTTGWQDQVSLVLCINAKEKEGEESWEVGIAQSSVLHVAQGQMAAEQKQQEERKVVPHFWNLNEDPSLTGMIVHFCREGVFSCLALWFMFD